MKHKKRAHFCSCSIAPTQGTGRKKGFALIASLTLMMLLGLIAVGILAVAATQNRIATHASLQTEARQQALMGLDAALAEMQRALGPDQRVTASSGILSEAADMPQHILGVWDSWTHALYDKKADNIESTYVEGRGHQFRRWLISCHDPKQLSELSAIRSLGTRMPGSRICMVGEGTLGHSAAPDEYIYADLIDMPYSGSNAGAFAWWVSGENQKASATVKGRGEENMKALSELEVLRRTWDTPPPNFEHSHKLSFLNMSDEDKAKMLTTESLSMPSGNLGERGAYYHHVTPYSYSLPINVRDGGLKHDLNLLLTQKDLTKTPFAPRTNQDCPIADDDAIPSGTEQNMPIGSWQVMHAYYNTWPNGEASSSDFQARLCGDLQNAYTRMSGHLEQSSITTAVGSDNVTMYDTRSISGSEQAGYARTPVMLAFLGAHGLAIGEAQSNASGNSYGLTYAPFVQWWNPYNVRMKVAAKKLWTYSLPYRTTSILFFSGYNNKWQRWLMYQPADAGANDTGKGTLDGATLGQRNTFANDWGNYFINKIDDNSDIVFEPGEILVFSMSDTFNNLLLQNQEGTASTSTQRSYSQPLGAPFVLGDHGGTLNNYFISMFSWGDWFGTSLRLSLESRHLYQYAVANRYIIDYVDPTDGDETNKNFHYDTIGDVLGPGWRELFAVVHGFDGIDDATQKANQNLRDSRLSSKPNRFFGARGISPNTFSLGWYDYEESESEEDLQFCGLQEGYTWSRDMALYEPTYFAAVGIIPKSFNPSAFELLGMFRGKDYRTKVWQHSNPALGSGALYKPTEQERQYSPFQLAALRMGSGLGRGSLDTVAERNGVYGTTSAGSGGGESTSFISCLELPYHPPFSLAGFAGMRLSPGWYKSGSEENSLAEMRRMQFHGGVPAIGIGNSFADPCIPANAVYSSYKSTKLSSTLLQTHKDIFSDYYDHALLINDALWDRWFCSSISDMPEIKKEHLITNFFEKDESLPVSRYKRNLGGRSGAQVKEKLLADEENWKVIARYLWIEGGFNVNSVSEEAWAATLQGLAKRDLLTNADGSLKRISKRADRNILFSRFMVSTASKALDDSYSPLEGSSSLRPNLKMATAWGELRELDPEEINDLAKEIVKKVRERGPFLNMSDFINRRLDAGNDTALTGALQAAIDATSINAMFKDSAYDVTPQKEGGLFKFQKAAEGSMYTAAPGYLIQSDVLSSLGNILTVRDDTFVVRAYGCVRNKSNAVLAQTWCEATVQRTIDYVDPTNSPEDCDRTDPNSHSKSAKKLTELNRIMGRKLRVISFRWLDSWDI